MLSGIFFNATYNKGMPLIYQHIDIQAGSVISVEEARYLFQTKQASFIDARATVEFQQNRIPNAINLPYRSPREVKLKILDEIPRDRLLIIYCQNAQCTLAERLARQLMQLGYGNVSIFSDGIDGWSAEGLPIVNQKETGK